MSTEATGDGKPDAVGAVKSGAEAGTAEPSATAVAEPTADEGTTWATEEITAWDATEPEPAGEQPNEVPPPDDDAAAGEAAESARASEHGEGDEPGEGDRSGEGDEPGESDEPDKGKEPGEGGEQDESDEDYEEYEEYADDDVSSGEDSSEYDGDYEEYADDEAVEPRRSRRWPRVLLALGFVALGAVIVGGAIAIVGSLTHGFKKPVKITYKTSAVFSLKTGDCFDSEGQQSYTLASCDVPHEAEVFATFALAGTKWPGATAVQAQASSGCASRLVGYVNPQLAISLSSTYVYPDSVAWQAGTRAVICEVRAASGELTGSVRGASATAG